MFYELEFPFESLFSTQNQSNSAEPEVVVSYFQFFPQQISLNSTSSPVDTTYPEAINTLHNSPLGLSDTQHEGLNIGEAENSDENPTRSVNELETEVELPQNVEDLNQNINNQLAINWETGINKE